MVFFSILITDTIQAQTFLRTYFEQSSKNKKKIKEEKRRKRKENRKKKATFLLDKYIIYVMLFSSRSVKYANFLNRIFFSFIDLQICMDGVIKNYLTICS